MPQVTDSYFSDADAGWMDLALSLARQAADLGEVPVGAVVVRGTECVGQGHNRTLTWNDPTAHAEVVALRDAAQRVGNHRLSDCELFVTLEPCLMCSGAMLHARLARVVFGASDPKTGVAQSVMNVFQIPALNHHTRLQSGLRAEQGAGLLHDFFRPKRVNPWPLREDALRTPEARFPLSRYQNRYVSHLPGLNGLRMHYLDELPDSGATPHSTWLAIHGIDGWSHKYESAVPALLSQGFRVLAPDLVGFGRSDKPKRERNHTREWHVQVLLEFLEHVDARNLALLNPDDGHGLGRSLQMACPARFLPPQVNACVPLLSLPDDPVAMNAPYPDAGHRAALRAFQAWKSH